VLSLRHRVRRFASSSAIFIVTHQNYKLYALSLFEATVMALLNYLRVPNVCRLCEVRWCELYFNKGTLIVHTDCFLTLEILTAVKMSIAVLCDVNQFLLCVDTSIPRNVPFLP
jgi:hypothetical protein